MPSLVSASLLMFFVFVTPAAAQIDTTLSDLENGAAAYSSTCATCHGEDGAGVPGIDFGRGVFRRATTEAEFVRILREGIAGTAMPKFALPANRMRNLWKYLRSLNETVGHSSAAGDPGHGKAIFEDKGACLTCHRVANRGSRLGPPLDEIGKRRTAAFLEQSLLDPDASVLSEYWFVSAVTHEGTKITGRRMNEDRNTAQLIDSSGRLLSVVKSNLREYAVVKASQMPSYKNKLTTEELRDLVKYLTTLREPGAATIANQSDASDQQSPRQH